MSIARVALTSAFVLVAHLAVAAGWTHYANARFGYRLDVPPGFTGEGEADNGDGQRFTTPTAELLAFGGFVTDGTFDDQVEAAKKQLIEDGVAITYEAQTPNAASLSGKKGGKIVYVRLISLCGGEAYGEFSLTYGRPDAVTFDPVVGRLVRSFSKAEGAC